MKTIKFSNASLVKSTSLLKSSTAIPPENPPTISYAFELKFTLSNPDAFDGYTQAGADAYAKSIATSNSYTIVGAGRESDVSGADSGAAYIYSNTTGALLHTLVNPNPYSTGTGDQFGQSLAITDTHAIVGAYQEDDAGGAGSGKAYIYSTTTGALLYTLDNPNAYDTSAGDRFGWSVDISENYAIVGAYAEDDTGGLLSSGKAYVYSLSNGQLVYTLSNPNASGTVAEDWFGYAVSITDTHAIVGAYQEDVGGSLSGSAYIFTLSNGQLLYTLNNPTAYGTGSSDYFGHAVAISNNYAIVGAWGEDDVTSATSSAGKAYIYSLSNGQRIYTLDDPNPVSTTAGDHFGRWVDVSDTLAIVSASGEGTSAGGGATYTTAGKAYVYNLATGSLVYTLDNPNAYTLPTTDLFSQYAVSISNNYISVGAFQEDSSKVGTTTASNTGRAYIFSASTGQLLHTLENPNSYGSSQDDYFSRNNGVSVSSMYTVIGAVGEDSAIKSGDGCAYIFSNTTGQQLYTLVNPDSGTSGTPEFGKAVATTNDYVAVGAPGYNMIGIVHVYNTQGQFLRTLTNPLASTTYFGNTLDIAGTNIIVGAYNTTHGGQAYIYNIETGALLHTLTNPNAYDTVSNDYFGYSVSISNSYAIVGAVYEDDANGVQSGKAYIYSTSTGALLHTLNNPNPVGLSVGDNFGYAVGISDTHAIVSAYVESDAGGAGSGKAYIYSTTTGALLYTLDNPNAYDTSANDYFGWSADISENYAIVGAYAEDDAGGVSSGKAYIFSLSNGQLVYTLNNPNAYYTSASDFFGISVGLSTNHAIVGAYGEDDESGTTSGKAYLYTLP